MNPPPGERVQRFVGDRIRITLKAGDGQTLPPKWRAKLRTNLGRAGLLRSEIIQAHTHKLSAAGASWHDLAMEPAAGEWSLELPLTEVGYFRAKAYLIDPEGWQHWPEGPDMGISVHPDAYRTANTIYCAFPRMFGETKTSFTTEDEPPQFKSLDQRGYTVIPPSGKLRDLIQELPHIIDTLGCRILHLLPVNPVPTTYARFGRFGSPYAALDLTAIDPALVVFDRRTTGVDQFCELTRAAHLRGGRVFLDIVINHTGWGSVLQEAHPEWFLRDADGSFVSPGAWGVIWEDLVELEHRHVELWDTLADVFLTWRRRGVDGFRCDAGYKVPLPAWQYITARVRREFPETIFLLEGLGGAWELTENLLTEGGMQWAYSELFQNYSGLQVAGYLDHSLKQSQRAGLLVHYSETHDNERLAARGRAWSLLRNRLCALTSVSGGFGFTCGVEWLAPERVNVHSSRGLAWGNPNNLIAELAQLNRLLSDHPCFFDGAKLTRLSPVDSPVCVLRRDSEEGKDSVLVLANNDTDRAQLFALPAESLAGMGELKFELTGQTPPKMKRTTEGKISFNLEPGAACCLSSAAGSLGLSGVDYRQTRARAAWGLTALSRKLPIESIPPVDWRSLAELVNDNPAGFLAAVSGFDSRPVQENGGFIELVKSTVQRNYPRVILWNLADRRRILPVPPHHWLLIQDAARFRATLTLDGGVSPQQVESIAVRGGHIACFAPQETAAEAQLALERFVDEDSKIEARIRFLSPGPNLDSNGAKPFSMADLPLLQDISSTAAEVKSGAKAVYPTEQPLVLLTNGIGGMARMCVDFGVVKSKYDCVLAANLDPKVPVDRHVFVKRARVWINADGFITPLDLRNLASFEPGPPATWHFLANAGDGRTVGVRITASMLEGRNTTVLHFDRHGVSNVKTKPLPEDCEVRLTARLDIEDRNFHGETKRNEAAENHFSTHTRPLTGRNGFVFAPAADRQLRVFSDLGFYHPAPEWSENIPHPMEQSRGQTGSGDAYSPGWFDLPLPKGTAISLIACADAQDPTPEEIESATVSPKGLPAQTTEVFAADDAFGLQLLQAARAFVVRRDGGQTVIAGYPWFLDWGRDSLICARGLLAAGMEEEVKQLLAVFGRFARDGTLPNTIHGEDASNRDTSDAPLWYGVVCEEAARLSGNELYQLKVGRGQDTIADVLIEIASGYVNGTPNGIRMDPSTGLIWSPSHFTWMDTNHPAGTPREGYPVEIQVLWIRFLRQLEHLGGTESGHWRELAQLAETSLRKYYWLEDRGYLADSLVAKAGRSAADAVVDNSLRSNCLLAVSLGLVSGEPARRCVEAAARYLAVPGALRSLAPLPVSPPLPIYGDDGRLLNNPDEPYWGRYEGDEDTRRKPAYHNGTAWTWTFPSFCEALARAWDCAPEAVAAAKAYLGSMDRLLLEGCLGQIPEIVDGDEPHTQRGCDAQAWGVTEALRVWKYLQSLR
ncbi:MAG TPA: amylo-alpha-1,6-glucosidase [Verrucomicrobiae bacterium]|nr:amylo-alpha-1,6-glucosidase [Verrucomicrobiae bacterium]